MDALQSEVERIDADISEYDMLKAGGAGGRVQPVFANALVERMIEFGAEDLDDTPPQRS